MRLSFLAALLFFAISIQALIDIRLFGIAAAPAILGISSAVFVFWALSLWYISTLGPQNPFWAASVMIAMYVIACDALGLVGAFYAGLRVVTGPQYLRIAAVVEAAVSRTTLHPKKAG
jgi:hypothetical protein